MAMKKRDEKHPVYVTKPKPKNAYKDYLAWKRKMLLKKINENNKKD